MADKIVVKRSNRIYEGRGEWLFQTILYLIITLMSITFIYPYWHIIVTSFSAPEFADAGGLKLLPRGFSVDAYKQMFQTSTLWRGYRNTLIVVAMGWATSLTLNILGAYPLSRKTLPFRNLFTTIIVMTMFVSGGTIPTYLLVRKTLGMMNTYWAVILPQCVSVSHLVIMRNYFMNLPDEMEEAATIDGANSMTILVKIILPLSLPMIATISLWVIVSNWNAYFNCLLYITDENKKVLQVIMRRIIQTGSKEYTSSSAMEDELATDTSTLKATSIILSTLPIIMVYPFLQKYFVKGVLIGSLKG